MRITKEADFIKYNSQTPSIRNFIFAVITVALFFCSGLVMVSYASTAKAAGSVQGGKAQEFIADEATGFADGSGDGSSAEAAFLIATPEHLDNMRTRPGYVENIENKGPVFHHSFFRLIADIDLSDYLSPSGPGYNGGLGWLPIGDRQDANELQENYIVLDGGGHSISGLWINRPGADAGLFGRILDSKISDLTLRIGNNGITGGEYLGGIAAAAVESSITRCSVNGSLSSTGADAYGYFGLYVGGIAGEIKGSKISGCSYSGSINAVTPVDFSGEEAVISTGGIVGQLRQGEGLSVITDCFSSVNFKKSGDAKMTVNAGGIAGLYAYYGNTIKNCFTAVTAEFLSYPFSAGANSFIAGWGNPHRLTVESSYAVADSVQSFPHDISGGTKLLTEEEASRKESYSGWDFTGVWGFDKEGNITLRAFGEVYDPPAPPDLTPLWIVLVCLAAATAAAVLTYLIYRRKKPLVVKETETRHIYIGEEKQPLPYDLTPKEREVAELLLEWKSRKDISEILGVTVPTVNTHVRNVYDKCDCRSQKEFIVKYASD